MREDPYPNEYRVLVPSNVSLRPNEHPEMMAKDITTRITEAISEQGYDFILANYANPDVIAHTGDYQASIKAVEIIDEQLGQIADAALAHEAILLITSDHGNVERLFDPKTGMPETQHDPNPVPFHLIVKEYERKKTAAEIRDAEHSSIGILADVAPTILHIMGIPKPKEMTGQSLLRLLLS
jgi:2,3-bisphosphoglycerate-independent phosphoglycerate mutase